MNAKRHDYFLVIQSNEQRIADFGDRFKVLIKEALLLVRASFLTVMMLL
jgi:hypothetical protein